MMFGHAPISGRAAISALRIREPSAKTASLSVRLKHPAGTVLVLRHQARIKTVPVQ